MTVDGEPVDRSSRPRVIALGLDQTEVVRRLGLSLNPMDFDLYEWLQTAPGAREGGAHPARPRHRRPLHHAGGLEARDDLLLGADLPAGQGDRRRASLQADHRLRLLRRLDASTSRSTATKYCIDSTSRRRRGRSCGDQGPEQPLHERAAGQLHPHHRQQLGDVDPGLQAGGRQGQPRRAGQLLRHGREEDRPDPVRDAARRTSCPSANSRSSSPRR